MKKMEKRDEMERKGEKKKEEGKGLHAPRGYCYPHYEPLGTTDHNDG